MLPSARGLSIQQLATSAAWVLQRGLRNVSSRFRFRLFLSSLADVIRVRDVEDSDFKERQDGR